MDWTETEMCECRYGSVDGLFNDDLVQVVSEGDPIVEPRPSPEIVLCVAGGNLKGGRGDWLAEKATELGVSVLVPVLCERSQVRFV